MADAKEEQTKKRTTLEVEIRDNRMFLGEKKVTNWAVKIIGAVCFNGTVEGYIIEHPPCTLYDESKKKLWRSYFTNDNLSSYTGIMSKIECKSSLQTIQHPFKYCSDQYLSDYLLKMTEDYFNSPDCVRLNKLSHQGKQSNEAWAYLVKQGSTFTVRFFKKDGLTVKEVSEEESGYVVTGKTFTRHITLSENLDGGFHNLIHFVRNNTGANFPAAAQIFGAAFMALNFQSIVKCFGFAPIPIVIGCPGVTKSTMTKLILRSVGVEGNVFDPTYPSLVELISGSPIPLLWEDAENFSVLGDLVMLIYNNSQRSKCDKASQPPQSMPICTTNGCFLKKINDPVKYDRFVTRVNFIPFLKLKRKRQTPLEKLKFAKQLTTLIQPEASSVFLKYLELEPVIESALEDDLMISINEKLTSQSIFKADDSRSDQNYALLFFFTGKILERAGFQKAEILNIITIFMEKHLSPFLNGSDKPTEEVVKDDALVQEMLVLIKQASTLNESRKFQKRCSKSKNKDCNENCLVVSLSKINALVNGKFTDAKIRRVIKLIPTKNLGCCGKKFFTGDLNASGNKEELNCIHIKLSVFDDAFKKLYPKGASSTVITKNQNESLSEGASSTVITKNQNESLSEEEEEVDYDTATNLDMLFDQSPEESTSGSRELKRLTDNLSKNETVLGKRAKKAKPS
ncbi:uncharacterized protein [Clytia hemisphaerica]|uniref:uncharacterized protein n=1 Tax=Clytia hemisphaerica TaxID=252671 RepID=UPI0034D497C9|eukprot:TCONS_00068717-protein